MMVVRMMMRPAVEIEYRCGKAKKGDCVEWVEMYFKDCVCNFRDSVSFGCGVMSLVCWGVAEIPQIITNFRTKSGHGVSLFFLLTWVVGDVFNLVGCVLEPATLPTQFYTALLYTVTTVVLVVQCVYYDHIRQWWKRPSNIIEANNNMEEDDSDAAKLKLLDDPSEPTTRVPLEMPRQRDFYYTSARSLAGSDTPPFQYSCLRVARSGPAALQLNRDDSDDEDDPSPLPPSSPTKSIISQPPKIPHSVGCGAFLATSANLILQGKSMMTTSSKRTLLQHEHDFNRNALGQWLGWLMAVIYVGGRFPQIWLNGLNPLMFIFALTANVTYVGSILVRSTEWEKIEANMPWLLDAIVCVALDFFIIFQYIHYKYVMQRSRQPGEFCRSHEDANKVTIL
ncbi:seven transmembrane protein 1-like isoform X2 [Malania oleifera]|uniref:seven transmembrane protein 1-like isoform X2 n=1 Tax=Malania oleifera TaxID=397392 RepID=UPI0025AE44B0|nr:seven transmembrane protein 1-like isoform X2 [Malania oleifera]